MAVSLTASEQRVLDVLVGKSAGSILLEPTELFWYNTATGQRCDRPAKALIEKGLAHNYAQVLKLSHEWYVRLTNPIGWPNADRRFVAGYSIAEEPNSVTVISSDTLPLGIQHLFQALPHSEQTALLVILANITNGHHSNTEDSL